MKDAVSKLQGDLARFGYLADEGLATAIHLAVRLRRPLLLEGEAGAGKTEVAKTLARWSGAELLRLQCYEGIDVSQAVYEWDYARQLLHLKAAETGGPEALAAAEDELFSERFLVRRPLLRALDNREGPPPVLPVEDDGAGKAAAVEGRLAFCERALAKQTLSSAALPTSRACRRG